MNAYTKLYNVIPGIQATEVKAFDFYFCRFTITIDFPLLR